MRRHFHAYVRGGGDGTDIELRNGKLRLKKERATNAAKKMRLQAALRKQEALHNNDYDEVEKMRLQAALRKQKALHNNEDDGGDFVTRLSLETQAERPPPPPPLPPPLSLDVDDISNDNGDCDDGGGGGGGGDGDGDGELVSSTTHIGAHITNDKVMSTRKGNGKIVSPANGNEWMDRLLLTMGVRRYGYLIRSVLVRCWWFRLLQFPMQFAIAAVTVFGDDLGNRLLVTAVVMLVHVTLTSVLLPFDKFRKNALQIILSTGRFNHMPLCQSLLVFSCLCYQTPLFSFLPSFVTLPYQGSCSAR
jgi:hypothetical protein